MADFLTHLFLPLTAAYVVWPDRFRSPAYLGLAVFGLLADLDKFLGHPGLLHSLVTLVPLCAAILLVEQYLRGRLYLAPVVVALILSHLVLDLVAGGLVPLLYPFDTVGIGLQYPARTTFGTGLFGVAIEGPLVSVRTTPPRPGFNTYGFINGYGVASALLFAVVYLARGPARDGTTLD